MLRVLLPILSMLLAGVAVLSSPASDSPRTSSRQLAAGPLTAAEKRLQGEWQAYDYGKSFQTYKISFDQRQFHAEGSASDWYTGRVAVRPDLEPAELDLVIEDCSCKYKGMASETIFRWEGESLVLAAPPPGDARPSRFVESSGLMMELRRREASEP